MKVALAQLNPTVGDLDGNCQLIQLAAEEAARAGAELLVTSELIVSGYPPKDLLLREGFAAACDRSVQRLAKCLPKSLGVLVGHPTQIGVPQGRTANGCSLLNAGKVERTIHKLLLPNYDVFDERRYFRPADAVSTIEFRGRKLGVHICEDAWWDEPNTFYHTDPEQFPNPVAELAKQGADVLINLSASPFEVQKPARREALLQRHVARHKLPFLFCNQVGGNDDLVFDGNSLVVAADGTIRFHMPGFRTSAGLIDLNQLPAQSDVPRLPDVADLLEALILGLQDYMRKSGFTDCVLGLSGGIDSALATYIAAQAVGPRRVHALLMPSRYSSDHSVSDSIDMVKLLGVDHSVIAIDDVHRAYEGLGTVGQELTASPTSLAQQNLQARIRGAIVMIRSNIHGWLPLATGNKSELATGYCTLYGDMCGGFAVLCDVLKRDVYALSRYINEVREGRPAIPWNIINKAPSAELAPNQFDQDTLPPYPVLDAILEGLVEREESIATLAKRFPIEVVKWVATRLDRNEYKRRQLPPGIKLSNRAFGSGRRMPMAARTHGDWEG